MTPVRAWVAMLLACTLAGCADPTPPPEPSPTIAASAPTGNLTLSALVTDLVEPVAAIPDGNGTLFIVERRGTIHAVAEAMLAPAGAAPFSVENTTPLIDLLAEVRTSGSEQGLLGLALHPDFAHNGVMILSFTDTAGDSVLARTHLPEVPGEPALEVLLRVDQPFANHNGGHVLYGPDGYLYFGLGDGGAAADPLQNGQNRGTLLGSILRLDVGAEGPYQIPPDNPFVDTPGSAPEVYAYGLRNPWRFAFAGEDLYVGDVGQDAWEELDRVPAGGNLGWNLFEGNHQYPSGAPAAAPGFVFPVAEYAHDPGDHCSITAGPWVEDPGLGDLVGSVLYADFCSGTMWAYRPGTGETEQLMDTGVFVSSFGSDARQRVLVLAYQEGNIYVLEREAGTAGAQDLG